MTQVPILLDIEAIMPLYGYSPKEGVSQEMRKAQFLNFKSRNPELFPPQITKGRWHRDSIESHLGAIYDRLCEKAKEAGFRVEGTELITPQEIKKPIRRKRKNEKALGLA